MTTIHPVSCSSSSSSDDCQDKMQGGNRPSPDVEDDGMDSDDVNIFVSPRHFVGRTPGPRATKQRIFDEEQAAHNMVKAETDGQKTDGSRPAGHRGVSLGVENVKYTFSRHQNFKESEITHRSLRRNTILSWILVIINCVLVVFSLYLIVLSVWTFTEEQNGGLTAYLFVDGFGLRSPVAIGAFLLLAGCIGVVNGVFLGAGQVAPSIVEGLQTDGRRRAFTIHQLLSAGIVLLLSVVLVSTIRPLVHVTNFGISTRTWRMMAITHPDKLCAYQVRSHCAGSTSFMCTKSSANKSPACPGHYCSGVCKSTVMHVTRKNGDLCRTCEFFRSYSDLRKCKSIEAHRETSRSCNVPLSRQIKRFSILIIVSASVIIIWVIIVVLGSLLSPLLSD